MRDAPVLFDIPLAAGVGTRKVALGADGTAFVYVLEAGSMEPPFIVNEATAAEARKIALDALSGRLESTEKEWAWQLLAASVLLLDRQLDEMIRADRAREAARIEEMAL